jgi:hypothetical protein
MKIVTKTKTGYQIYGSKARYSLENASKALSESSLILKEIKEKNNF